MESCCFSPSAPWVEQKPAPLSVHYLDDDAPLAAPIDATEAAPAPPAVAKAVAEAAPPVPVALKIFTGCFFILFLSYLVLQQFLTSVLGKCGFYVLVSIYASFCVGTLCAPAIVRHLGLKRSMVGSAAAYTQLHVVRARRPTVARPPSDPRRRERSRRDFSLAPGLGRAPATIDPLRGFLHGESVRRAVASRIPGRLSDAPFAPRPQVVALAAGGAAPREAAVVAGGACGFAAAVLWTAQGAFCTAVAQANEGSTAESCQAYFWAFFSTAGVVGFGLALLLLDAFAASEGVVLWTIAALSLAAVAVFALLLPPLAVSVDEDARPSVGINHWSTAARDNLQTPLPRPNRTRFP